MRGTVSPFSSRRCPRSGCSTSQRRNVIKLYSHSGLGCFPRRRRWRSRNIGQSFQCARWRLMTSKRFRNACCRMSASWHCYGVSLTNRSSRKYEGCRSPQERHNTALAITRRPIASWRTLMFVTRSRGWQCMGAMMRSLPFLDHPVSLISALQVSVPRLVVAPVSVTTSILCQCVLLGSIAWPTPRRCAFR